MDPLAELYYSFSPYTWCENNPVNSIDPTGMATMNAQTLNSTFIDENGNFIEHRDDEDNKVYQVKDVAVWRKNGSKKEDAEQVGFEYPRLNYNVYEKGESVIYFGSKALFMPGWLNDGPIVIDNTFETMAIPVFGWLKYLKLEKSPAKLMIKSVDDLLRLRKKMRRVNAGGQVVIKGNIDDIFKSLSKGGKQINPNQILLPDGTLITKYPAKSESPTLQINQGGKIKKIRVEK